MLDKQRLTVRMPKSLNTMLTNKANEMGMSKNSLVLQILWKEVNKQQYKEIYKENNY